MKELWQTPACLGFGLYTAWKKYSSKAIQSRDDRAKHWGSPLFFRKWTLGTGQSFRTWAMPPPNTLKVFEVWERKSQAIRRMWVWFSVLVNGYYYHFLSIYLCVCVCKDSQQGTWAGCTEDEERAFGSSDSWCSGKIQEEGGGLTGNWHDVPLHLFIFTQAVHTVGYIFILYIYTDILVIFWAKCSLK